MLNPSNCNNLRLIKIVKPLKHVGCACIQSKKSDPKGGLRSIYSHPNRLRIGIFLIML